MNKKIKHNLKLLRSDFEVPYIGPIKEGLPQNVVPYIKEVLQVVFNLQLVDKLPMAQCICKVTDLLCMPLPGYEYKAKSHITRQIKKVIRGWQSN